MTIAIEFKVLLDRIDDLERRLREAQDRESVAKIRADIADDHALDFFYRMKELERAASKPRAGARK